MVNYPHVRSPTLMCGVYDSDPEVQTHHNIMRIDLTPKVLQKDGLRVSYESNALVFEVCFHLHI